MTAHSATRQARSGCYRFTRPSGTWVIALFRVDFYLSGAVLPFDPPAPFREDEHRANVVPNRGYTRNELKTYLDYSRRKARDTLEALTNEQAAAPLPPGSQHAGRPFVDLLFGTLLHTQEHAAQMNLFIGQRGASPASMRVDYRAI